MKFLKNIYIFLMIILLSACTTGAKTWQDHYDLGMRYLSEGNYEEAILSFTAAIEIDAKRIEAYIGRGDAYFAFEELEEHFESAIVDFETALGLDEMYVDAYLKLADVYFAIDDKEQAIEILKKGFKLTNDDRLLKRLEEKGYSYYSNVTAKLIVNEIVHAEEEMAAMDSYPDICLRMFGIRFIPPVESEIGTLEFGKVSEAQIDFSDESGITYEMLNILDEWDEDTMMSAYNWEYLDKEMIVSGYLTFDENHQKISNDGSEMVFIPNGPYTFELLEWSFK